MHIATLLLLSAQVLVAAEGTADESSEPTELREPPPVEEVQSITAQWFDAGYGSYVRGWSVPDKQWDEVLEAVKDCREQEAPEADSEPEAGSNQVHLRIVTTDGRTLTIIASGEGGELRAYPFRGCKAPFQFTEHGAPFLRQRLGTAFRTALEEREDDQG